MVKLKEVRGLGSERVELPDGSVIEYDAQVELEQIASVRSKCAWGECKTQSVSGSMFCEEHLEHIQREEGRR